MSTQLDDMITGSDVMFGWSTESHQGWLESMVTPPCSPPPNFGSLEMLADPTFALPRSTALDEMVPLVRLDG
jgi:hypothetical protein